eukprot:7333641-Prymnesium_polylepis.1
MHGTHAPTRQYVPHEKDPQQARNHGTPSKHEANKGPATATTCYCLLHCYRPLRTTCDTSLSHGRLPRGAHPRVPGPRARDHPEPSQHLFGVGTVAPPELRAGAQRKPRLLPAAAAHLLLAIAQPHRLELVTGAQLVPAAFPVADVVAPPQLALDGLECKLVARVGADARRRLERACSIPRSRNPVARWRGAQPGLSKLNLFVRRGQEVADEVSHPARDARLPLGRAHKVMLVGRRRRHDIKRRRRKVDPQQHARVAEREHRRVCGAHAHTKLSRRTHHGLRASRGKRAPLQRRVEWTQSAGSPGGRR